MSKIAAAAWLAVIAAISACTVKTEYSSKPLDSLPADAPAVQVTRVHFNGGVIATYEVTLSNGALCVISREGGVACQEVKHEPR